MPAPTPTESKENQAALAAQELENYIENKWHSKLSTIQGISPLTFPGAKQSFGEDYRNAYNMVKQGVSEFPVVVANCLSWEEYRDIERMAKRHARIERQNDEVKEKLEVCEKLAGIAVKHANRARAAASRNDKQGAQIAATESNNAATACRLMASGTGTSDAAWHEASKAGHARQQAHEYAIACMD